MYPPDGLLTLEDAKHDVELNPHIIAPDPFASEDCLNAFPPIFPPFLLTTAEELNIMNTGDDESPSGLQGRLRPRKSHVAGPQTPKVIRKTHQDKPKRTPTPSKASPNKQDDLVDKSEHSHTPQFLCAYCDKKFASKQAVSKHTRRIHISTSKQDSFINCLFCNTAEANFTDIIRHMVDSHPNQYFACLNCHTRFPSTSELAEHKLNVCEKQKVSYRSKLRQKSETRKNKKSLNVELKEDYHDNRKEFQTGHDFNGIVISCELKPSQVHNEEDIEENITTNLILPPSKSLGSSAVLDKSAVIVLDDIQWNKRIPSNFSFHNTDADQILSRLGVVHRSPRTGESTRREWLKNIDDSTQKFERCFDTNFYSKVASNVQENLTKFLDGSCNFNPDPDSVIKTRKAKNSVPINTAEGFPILLACEQYSRNECDGYMPRAVAPKHKWKWDNLESDKIPSPNQIKRDAHTNNCIITLVSSLDIWTQLSMRRKFEEKFGSQQLQKKTEKQNVIGKELKEILESRVLPSSSQVIKFRNMPVASGSGHDFAASLGLSPTTPSYDLQPAVLSGEWVRPRCYVCCACGVQTHDSKTLSLHISAQHPNAQVQHYEIVGEPLLNADILKHLYVPPSQMSNRTRPPRGIRECTKCKKPISLDDLHQHMLDCAGDLPAVRRRQCRYRPFGVRRRRPRLPDNTVRKKIRKDIRTRQRRQKAHMRPRQKVRTEVGDAETIRKMLADLPAKRHRVMVNPMNQTSRPRKKLEKQRNKLVLKRKHSEDSKKRQALKDKGTDKALQAESAKGDDPKEDLSNKEDDEDDKPLKPKLTLVTKSKRRSQPVKKKPIMNRIKRKSVCIKRKKRNVENVEKSSDSSKTMETQKLSIDNPPQKIDVKGGSYNAREHANRGESNNRDEQRPGCNEPNANPNNMHASAQNIPLKHSIARLTADSERHDKSVQFHHLFLVQQECNNTNQHLPSGQHTLFENETVVTRLDKPPLNYIQREAIDFFTLQKSKQNKPRKGLNDCIAMLRNKLSDPNPCSAIGQISVKCGSDEPLDLQPQVVQQNVTADAKINYDHRPDVCQSSLTSEEVHYEVNTTSPGYAEARYRRDSYNESYIEQQFLTVDNASKQYENCTKQRQSFRAKRKSSRRSSVTHRDPTLTQNKQTEITPEVVIIPHKCDDTRPVTIPQRPYPEEVSSPKAYRTRARRGLPRDADQSQQFLVPSGSDFNQQRSENTYLPSEPNVTIKTSVAPSELDPMWQNPLEVPSSNIIVQNPSEDYTQNQSHVKKQTQMNVMSENNMTMQKPNEILSENDVSRALSVELFPEDNIITIPPAHASTMVESIISTPLDLSASKSGSVSDQKSTYISSYDDYETLDLSNKSCDRLRSDRNTINDVVVDLSVRATHLDYERSTIDLSIRAQIDDLPTDLSMRGKDNNINADLSGRTDNIDYVQDLSSNQKTKQSQSRPRSLSGTEDRNNKSQKGICGKQINQSWVASSETMSIDLTDSSARCNERSSDFIEKDDKNTPTYTAVKTVDQSLNITRNMDKQNSADLSVHTVVMNMDRPSDFSMKVNKSKSSVSHMVIHNDRPVDIPGKYAKDKDTEATAYSATIDSSQQFNESGDKERNVQTPTCSVVRNNDGPSDFARTNDKEINLEVPGCSVVSDSYRRVKEDSVQAPVCSLVKNNDRPANLENIDQEKTVEISMLSTVRESECTFDTLEKLCDDTNEISTYLKRKSTLHVENTFKNRKEYDKIHNTTSSTLKKSSTGDKSVQVPKPIYDPTLKIPQYKIRATSETSIVSDTGISHKVSTLKSANDSESSAFGPALLKTSTFTVAGSSLPNAVRLSSTITKFENTTSVYSLANTYMSVTKVDQVSSATEPSILKPKTSITDCSTDQKLANSTAYTQTITDASKTKTISVDSIECTQTGVQTSKQHTPTSFDGDIRNENLTKNKSIDQDFETARKIAMLPKELVEILGTMPADHRNQLLNILPQYVSTSTPNLTSQSDTAQILTNATSLISKTTTNTVSSKQVTNDDSVITPEPQHTAFPNSNSSLTNVNHGPNISLQNSQCSHLEFDNKQPIQCDSNLRTLPTFVKSKTNDDTKLTQTKQCSRESVESVNDKSLDSVNSDVSKKTLIEYNDSIIDLTEEENIPLKIAEDLRSVNLPPQDFIAVGKPRQKGNNDQTASLRAVRIKAPSERHKDNQLLKRSSLEQISKSTNVNDSEDDELKKSSESLAIQQAEVSSTQHTNKNVVADTKLSPQISPNKSQASVEDSNVKSRRESTSDVDGSKGLGGPVKTDKPTLKSGVVTSSISANETSAKQSGPDDIHNVDNDIQNSSSSMIVTNDSSNVFVENLLTSVTDREQNILNMGDSKASVHCVTSKHSAEVSKDSEDKSCLSKVGTRVALLDEDSDDDVSLALIVKQKQMSSLKTVLQTDENSDNLAQNNIKSIKSKKRKRDNKLKKVNRKNTLTEHKTNANIELGVKKLDSGILYNNESCQKDIPKDLIKEPLVENSINKGVGLAEKHSKKKNMKSVNSQETKKNESQGNKNVECDIHKEDSSDIQKNKVKTSVETEKLSTNEQKENSFRSSNVFGSNEKSNDSKNNTEFKEFLNTLNDTSRDHCTTTEDVVNLQKVNTRKKNNNKTETTSTNIDYSILKDKDQAIIDQKSQVENKEYTKPKQVSKELISEDDKLNPDNDLQTLKNYENKRNKKSSRAGKLKYVDQIEDNNSSQLQSESGSENITPLRRSRRGKSLFIENNAPEHESTTNSESSLDQKTPLTKKQLIFSKLLLDEEKSDATLEKRNLNLGENSIPSSTENEKDNFEAHDTSECVYGNELSSDNYKSIKRKKSPLMKRNCKKKKSLEICKPSTVSDINKGNDPETKDHSDNSSLDISNSATRVIDKELSADQPTTSFIQQHSNEVIRNSKGKSSVTLANVNKINIVSVHDALDINKTKASASLDKRKLITATNIDLNQSTTAKRTKINENSEISLPDTTMKINEDGEATCNYNPNVSSEVRSTCYNMPVAARRTRSKSVVVKSSAELYDPYDIDLDDMIENTEPFRKKSSISRENKTNSKLKLPYNVELDKVQFEAHTSEKQPSNTIFSERIHSDTRIKMTRGNKTEIPATVTSNTITNKDSENYSTAVNIVSVNSVHGNISDSDESSKSDVPLKKYVEGRGKKMALSHSEKESNEMEIDESAACHGKQVSDEVQNNIQTPGVASNADGTQKETEKQLRSEQFMESFGFFSERKPRKSNLLATKKISETFHTIANENDDLYYGYKDRPTKKSVRNESRIKAVEEESKVHQSSLKTNKPGRKKKSGTKVVPCYCGICKKEFRRPDNYLRHQMTLLHISKLSEVEMKVKTNPVREEPNYLIPYKQQVEQLKMLTNKLAKQKKNARNKIKLPTMQEILATVQKTVRDQQLSQRGLSRDEALFLDCCELLKESHKNEMNLFDFSNLVCPTQPSVSGVNLIVKPPENKVDTKSDGDVDSITAKRILESDEVRFLENDLFSGLKEAANKKNSGNILYKSPSDSAVALPCPQEIINPPDKCSESVSNYNNTASHIEQAQDFNFTNEPSTSTGVTHSLGMFHRPDLVLSEESELCQDKKHEKELNDKTELEDLDAMEEPDSTKAKKYSGEVKDKMYPDLENIDIFEDKFDKIKRKCRSQAAAAKQTQTIIETSSSHKGRKRSEKKKGKKKRSQNTVLTKGALKGFDGIKVSIPTSDINISAIVSPLENLPKKKKKTNSKKKREKKDSISSNKNENDSRVKISSTETKVDVYEFMDNEDAELFEFRPSTLMERFKSISGKETQSRDKSKFDSVADEPENSSDSASDGDDFVYMSDDYVCSDDETENSLMSCEMGNVKTDNKKSSPLKRKDIVDKNAVMGKIFKHNAVRSEKKSTKSKEPVKPQANLDQLFDSLLEDEPNSSFLSTEGIPNKDEYEFSSSNIGAPLSQATYDQSSPKPYSSISEDCGTIPYTSSKNHNSSPCKDLSSLTKYDDTTKVYNDALRDYGPLTSKKGDMTYEFDRSKNHDSLLHKKRESNLSNNYDISPTRDDSSPSKSDALSFDSRDNKLIKETSPPPKEVKSDNFDQVLLYEDTGVARQRARRKCTVGKQNVLAETWSSESEPDGGPPARPNSAESVVTGSSRKKKGKKKEGQQSGGKRGHKHVSIKKDVDSRVNSGNRNTSSVNVGAGHAAGSSREAAEEKSSEVEENAVTLAAAASAVASTAAADVCPPPAMPGPSAALAPPAAKGRPRSLAFYWSSEGSEEQEHLQQHGWIVGDSHKKLVTMLAHAKGRKRNSDEKRHLVE